MKFEELVNKERAAQDAKWGGPANDDNNTPRDWCAIMVRHLGLGQDDGNGWDEARFLRQLVRVAALCKAAYESRVRAAGMAAGPPPESRGKGY